MICHSREPDAGTRVMRPVRGLFLASALLMSMLLCVFPALGQTPPSVSEATATTPLEQFLSNPAVNAATTSVYIAEIGSGRVLASHNADLPLLGASTMKLVTIATLMRSRDISYRYHTRVETAGRVVKGVLEGNLHVIGNGDPTLNTDRTPKTADFTEEIVASLRRRGIDTIRGRVLIDESLFEGPACPESWGSGDRNADYGTGAHAFNYGRNRSGSRSVANPSAVFVSALERRMAKAGIVIENRTYNGGGRRELMTHVSAPLDEIMRSCMMRSDNLYAECLLRQIAIAKGGKGSVTAGVEAVNSEWRQNKAPMQGVRIADGSGLSRSNRLTAHFLAHVLRAGSMDPYFASFFPLAGAEGTLRSFLRGTRLETYIALKTGSLHDVQAYAGYRLDDDYAPTHVVVVIANGFRKSRYALRAAVEKLLLAYL